VGNSLEVVESIAILRGEGPADVRDLTLALASEMLVLAGLETDLVVARGRASRAVESGAALGKFREIIEAQGGDPRVVDEPSRLPRGRVVDEPSRLPRARHVAPALSPRAGFVTAIDAYAVGELIVRMGGGRARKEDKIDHRVGLVLASKVGDRVALGDPLAEVHAERDGEEVARALVAAYTIGDAAGEAAPLVIERLGGGAT
jgi:thymidine phosphorylase